MVFNYSNGAYKRIVLGDTTTHGGRVISATCEKSYGPHRFAQAGDSVTCPQCGGVYRIENGPLDYSGHEVPYAVEGQRTSCGATLVSRESLGLTMKEDGTLRSIFSDPRALAICEKINKYKSGVTPTGEGGVFSYTGGGELQSSWPYFEHKEYDTQESIKETKTALYLDLKNEDTRFEEFLPFKITVEPSEIRGVLLNEKKALVGIFDSGTYTIIIEPTPPIGEELGPIPIHENSKFKRQIVLSEKEQYLTISITRTESILHNIQMTFLVEEPPKEPWSTDIHRMHAHSTFSINGHFASRYAGEFSLDQNIIHAIMYLEETQGWYDAFIPNNKSIRPMNVNIDYWEKLYTARNIVRDDLYDASINIREGCFLIHRMDVRAKPHTPKVIATLYNSHKAQYHLRYGFHFQEIYNQKPWIDTLQLIPPVSFD